MFPRDLSHSSKLPNPRRGSQSVGSTADNLDLRPVSELGVVCGTEPCICAISYSLQVVQNGVRLVGHSISVRQDWKITKSDSTSQKTKI